MRLVFITALLLLALAASAGSPTVGDVTLKVKDAQQRPVVNVSVTIEYTSTEPYFGELHKTDVIYSNQFGIAQKRISADYNTPFKVTVQHHDANQVIDTAWVGVLDRFVNLPLADFSIRTVDSESNSLGNIPLRIIVQGGGFNSSTNASGYRLFPQYNTELVYLVYARYGGKEHFTQVIPDGRLHNIQIPTYTLEIRTIDDNGNSAPADMNFTFLGVNNITKRTVGIVGLFSQVPEGNAAVVLTHGSRTIRDVVYVNSSVVLTYVFDMSPPAFSSPVLVPAKPVPENEVEVFINITDPGRNASGLPPLINYIPPAELYYSLDGVRWSTVRMYPEAGNRTYHGTIPGQPANSVVRYYVTAWDRMNNTATSPQYVFNTYEETTPTDGNQPPIDPLAMLVQFWWVGAIIILAAAAYFAKKRYF